MSLLLPSSGQSKIINLWKNYSSSTNLNKETASSFETSDPN